MEFIKQGQKQYKANLHCHSSLSDGKLTPHELKTIYKSEGYSILAITDHEYPFDHSKMSEEDFLMLTGYEVYIRPGDKCKYDIYEPEIHLNLLAKNPHNVCYVNYVPEYCKYIKDEEYKSSLPKFGDGKWREYTPEYINSFLKTAADAGYIAAYNHPVWSLEDMENILKYEGFFSMEMCNWGSYISNFLEYNGAIYDTLLRHGKRIFCHSSDDNHNHHPRSSPRWDSFGAFTMILADTLDYQSVIKALEDGSFYSSMGPEIKALQIENGKAYIKTTPAARITMHYGSKTPSGVFAESGDALISEASFEIPKDAKYVRFTVDDGHGKFADTRGFWREEF